MVLEVGPALEVDGARRSRGHLLAVVVDDVDGSRQGPAHRPGVGQPVLRRYGREAVPFRARVVLVDDRAPPVDHLTLHRDRAGRGGVDGALEAGQVVAAPLLLGELEQPHEHGGHQLGVGDAVSLDGREILQRVEVLHDHHGAADALKGQGEAQRRRVVLGGGG